MYSSVRGVCVCSIAQNLTFSTNLPTGYVVQMQMFNPTMSKLYWTIAHYPGEATSYWYPVRRLQEHPQPQLANCHDSMVERLSHELDERMDTAPSVAWKVRGDLHHGRHRHSCSRGQALGHHPDQDRRCTNTQELVGLSECRLPSACLCPFVAPAATRFPNPSWPVRSSILRGLA